MKSIKCLILAVVLLLSLGMGGCKQKQSMTFVLHADGVSYGFSGTSDGSRTHIQIPERYQDKIVTAIEPGALKDNRKVTDITIPQTVTVIGSEAFFGCTNLSTITYSGTKEQWTAIEKGENWQQGTGYFVICCTDGDLVLSGVYQSEEMEGTYFTYCFDGVKVRLDMYLLGDLFMGAEGTWEVSSDRIRFEWNSGDAEGMANEMSFEKTENGVKIGSHLLKRR